MKKKLLTIAKATVMAAVLSSCCSNNGSGECPVKNNAECPSKEVCKSKIALENIMTRTSIRAYQDKPVEDEKIELIMRAAMAAPSARNVQPWSFVVVKDTAILKKMAEANHGTRMAANAPLAIAVCGDMNKALGGQSPDFWIQDCAAVTENILLSAHALGLGAVWTGIYPNLERVKAMCDILGTPDTQLVFSVIPIGYPAENPEPKDKWNPDCIHYNQW